MKIIGIASTTPQVGKSTIGDYLLSKYAFRATECSDPVIHISKKYFGFNGDKEDPRQRLILQKVGLFGKEIEPAIWLYYTLMQHKVRFNENEDWDWEKYTNFKTRCQEEGLESVIDLGVSGIYVSGIRSPSEADAFLDLGGQVWLIRRKAAEGEEGSKHKVESQLSSYNKFTTIIDNDGTFEELYEKVDEMVV